MKGKLIISGLGALLFVVFLIDTVNCADFIPPVVTSSHPRFFAQLTQVKTAWQQLATATTEPAVTWFDFLKRHATSDLSLGNPSKAWLTHHTITMYQITGDSSWASLAWQGVQQNLIDFANSDPTFGGDNNARVIVDIWIDTYDWIYNYLDAAKRTQFRNTINKLIDFIFLQSEPCCEFDTYNSWPIRSTDTDVLLHNYFALIKWYVASGDDSTYIHDRYLTNSTMNIGGVTPTKFVFPSPPGGQCANGCFQDQNGYSAYLSPNLRTAIAAVFNYYYVGGGGWYPSGYMLEGVHSRVAYDWAGLYTAFGQDYFPEVGASVMDQGIKLVKMSTNDGLWMYRWSDDEVGHGGQTPLYITLSVLVTTSSWFNNTDVRQQYALWLMNGLLSNNPNMVPYDEFYFAFQYTPALQGQSIATATTNGNFPKGDFGWDMEGLGSYHTGWTAQDSTYFFEFQPYSFFDHFTIHVGNFALYRKGQWGPYSPISYGAPTADGEVTNTMTFYGFPLASQLSQVREYKGMLGTSFGSNWAFWVGANCGTINGYDGRYTYTTSTFIQEYSRSSLFYHGTKADVILVFDRSHILDPQTLPYWTNDPYSFWSSYPDLANKVSNGQLGRRTWQWHAVTQPSFADGGIINYLPVIPNGDENSGYSFTASSTQTVTMTTHFSCTTVSYHSTSSIPQQNPFDWNSPDNTGFIIYESSAFDQPWDATLHVIAMADVGSTVDSQAYTAYPAVAKMAVVTMPSPDNNVVAIYNVQQGPTIPSPNCCDTGAAGSCPLGNYPCNDDPTVQTIVPTQHYFYSNVTYFGFSNVALTTSTVDIFLHDLNPAISYDLFINQVNKQTVAAGSPTVGFVHIPVTGVTPGNDFVVCVEVTGTGTCATTTTFQSPTPVVCPTFYTASDASRVTGSVLAVVVAVLLLLVLVLL